jgi:uncharacterized protein (DUF2235 family)
LGTGWKKITGNVGGMGISRNIRECYEFIFENYQKGRCCRLPGNFQI